MAQRWRPETWRDQILKYASLRHQDFDLGFDFQGHSKTALCLKLAGCKRRLSSRATDALASRLNPPEELALAGPHEVDVALALVQKALDVSLPSKPIMPALTEEREWWQGQLAGKRPLVSLQTGAGESDKSYPVGRWTEVAEALSDRGCTVVAIGGPNDPKIRSPKVFDAVGTQSLTRALALVSLSDVHIAADTGTGHAAAAYGVPVVSVFGRTDPARFRPYTKRGIVLREGIDTKAVMPEQIMNSVLLFLEGEGLASPD